MYVKTKCLVCYVGYPEDATTSIGLSKVSKQLSIAWLPEILVLQVKRFSLGYRVTKCTDAITFPLILDMAQYCTNECLQVIFHPYHIYILFKMLHSSK